MYILQKRRAITVRFLLEKNGVFRSKSKNAIPERPEYIMHQHPGFGNAKQQRITETQQRINRIRRRLSVAQRKTKSRIGNQLAKGRKIAGRSNSFVTPQAIHILNRVRPTDPITAIFRVCNAHLTNLKISKSRNLSTIDKIEIASLKTIFVKPLKTQSVGCAPRTLLESVRGAHLT